MSRLALAAGYLAGTRLRAYADLLGKAGAWGYRLRSIRDAAGQETEDWTVTLRHDVDAASPAVPAMLAAERSLGARASYYFRRSTIDPALMAAVEAAGGDAGYHYECLADYAGEHALFTRSELLRTPWREHGRARLKRELAALRRATGLPVATAASHGHAVNRRLGVPNNALFAGDPGYPDLGLTIEAYDPALVATFDAIVCDAAPDVNGGWLYGETLESAMARGARRILFQTHPHHWAQSPAGRLRRAAAVLLRGPRRVEAAFRIE